MSMDTGFDSKLKAYMKVISFTSQLSHWSLAKAQTSLHICVVLPEPSLLAIVHVNFGTR